MKSFWIMLLVVVGVAGVWGAELALRPTEKGVVFGSESFAVELDGATGWMRAVLCDGREVVADGGSEQLFDIQGDSGWVTGRGSKIRGEGVERAGSDTVRSRLRAGEWQLDVYLQLMPQKRMVRRWFEIWWLGEKPTKIRHFWFQAGRCSMQGKGGYLVPVVYPPKSTVVSDLRAGHKSGSWQSPFVVLADSGAGWSAMWALDELPAYADSGSSGVEEMVDGIRVTQSFNMRGHVRRGEPQRVGDAWLWLESGTREEQLRQMGRWFESVGQVPPEGRPEWLKRVTLYSFHPGGTTGSMCRDLGGFPAATALLPHIAGMGCNAVWLMPVEDKSIYWPRDYYKLQQGIGTPDDYKAFVARAHEMEMKVWQDCVPHGGGNTNERAREHPEWLAQNEDGSTLHYWCFDFNWPTWIDYMRDVVSFYTQEYKLDGFRIDACGGSKIPNWNPEIPYMRASHAQAQGGFAMQRALREAVRAINPDGANLAEVGASVHGAISDSTYDFALCYQVLHDFRKVSPRVFVPRLQRWLHEQHYAQIPDLIRMRHIESHDSLRSVLLYGAEAQRALFALSAWIHGIPMVYHEMEDGHYEAIREVLHVRRHLAELNVGDADYLGVAAPEGVFACLRFGRLPERDSAAWHRDYGWEAEGSDGERASVVLVNLNSQSVSGDVVLPEWLHKYSEVCNLMTGEELALRGGKVEVELAPFAYTVLRVGAAPQWQVVAPLEVEEVQRGEGVNGNQIEIGSVVIDGRSGFVTGVKRAGRVLPVEMDLVLPAALASGGGAVEVERVADGVRVRRQVGEVVLKLYYRLQRDGDIGVEAAWSSEEVPEEAALVMRLPEAQRWFADAAEGRFGGVFRVRHPNFEGTIGSIYRLAQGTAVFWDSRLHPFGLVREQARIGGGGVEMAFDVAPGAVQLWDRSGEVHGLHVAVLWGSGSSVSLVLGSYDVEPPRSNGGVVYRAGELKIIPAGGGWIVENRYYRVRLARTGEIMEYEQFKGGEWLPVMEGSYFYTDRGYSSDKRYSQQHEVETFMRFERAGTGEVRMAFSGDLRGSYRFDKMRHPVQFYSAYTFGSGAAFRRECAVRATAAPHQGQGYLALFSPLHEVEQVRWQGKGGQRAVERRVAERYLQSVESGWLPSEVEIKLANGAELRLSDMEWLGGEPANVFMYRSQLHMAWMDGKRVVRPGGWHGVSMSVSSDDTVAARGGAELVYGEEGGGVLPNIGFGSIAEREWKMVTQGRRFTAPPKKSDGGEWRLPAGGQYVVDGGGSLHIVGEGGEYRLASLVLPATLFERGSEWQLRAEIKGGGVKRGKEEWMTACLRWSVMADGKRSYITSSLPFGDSDWQEYAVRFVVPEKLDGLAVEAGLNGNAGECWIGKIRLEKVR